ncbi:MAG: flippase-like domain-containing protein [Deltaproteobacteria bacterium]|nr:flippase-like domain-containing protein [Deltaproteobacteria bacterium]
MPNTIKRLLPWLLSLAIVGYLFASVDLGAVREAMAGADLAALTAWLAFFAVVVFLADSLTLHVLLARLLDRLGFRDVLAVKGVSYFLNALNYSAGAGAVAWFAHRKTRRPFLSALSTLLWLNFIDIVALLVLLGFGITFGREHVPADLADRLVWVLLAGWFITFGALAYWRLGLDFLVLGRLRTWRIFHAFREAHLADYAVMVALRTLFIGLYVLMTFATLPTFGIRIGLGALLVYVPLLTFVQIVPASVSGLGAIQVVMIALYAPHVAPSVADPAAQVLAYSTIAGPLMTLVRLVIGYLFMANVTRDLVPDEATLAAARGSER